MTISSRPRCTSRPAAAPGDEFLGKKAGAIRDSVIGVAVRNGAGHIAPSLSCVDILTALYYEVMTYDPENPLWEGRDRLILSKGHGCYSLYAILADLGVIPAREWESFSAPDSSLSGCAERCPEYGIEAGCGSLGHGLPLAVGLAFGAGLQKLPYHTYCVTGDGELQEGTTWEAIQFAVKRGLSNLTVIVDRNRLQAMDFTAEIMDRDAGDLERRLSGFGLEPVAADGHDPGELASALKRLRSRPSDLPAVVVARTVKGFGLPCMENDPKFHFRIPGEAELEQGRSHE